MCVAAENVLGSAVLEQRLGSAFKAALGQSKHTGSYSWPNQIDVRFCPSSAPYFHMNAEYAKAKKRKEKRNLQDPCPMEPLQGKQICRENSTCSFTADNRNRGIISTFRQNNKKEKTPFTHA